MTSRPVLLCILDEWGPGGEGRQSNSVNPSNLVIL
jgi:hypothetical protein